MPKAKSKKLELLCKPMSVNKVWQGRRFKTKDYKAYEKEVSNLIGRVEESGRGAMLEVIYKFYLKNHKRTDYDNLIKPLQDILVKKGVIKDDRYIYKATIEKIPSPIDKIEIEIICLQEDQQSTKKK